MLVTNTRDITNLEPFQQQPETTVNDALVNLDRRDQVLTLSSQTGGTVTLTKDQALCGIWLITGTLTSALIVKFPATGYTRAPIVYNGTTGAFTVTVSPNSGGSGQEVSQGMRRVVYFDGTNVVEVAGTPFCLLTHSAAQSIPSAAETALLFNTEYADTDGMHSTVTNNSRITVQIAGRYEVGGSVDIAGSSGGSYRDTLLKRFNSSGTLQEVFGVCSSRFSAAVPSRLISAAPTQAICSVGEFFEIHISHDAGVSLNSNATSGLYGATYKFAPLFWARRIG